MARWFINTREMAKELERLRDQAKQRSQHYANRLQEHEAAEAAWKRDPSSANRHRRLRARHEVKNGGGVSYMKEVVAREQGMAYAYDDARRMLSEVLEESQAVKLAEMFEVVGELTYDADTDELRK